MIGKNGIDWEAMGFTVCGECSEYISGFRVLNKSKERNVTFTPAHKLWQRLIRIDRGQELSGVRDNLCEEWKDFNNFEKWYNQHYYEIEGEEVGFSYRFWDIYNTWISPETSCFLPKKLNHLISKMSQAGEKGLLINIMVDGKNKDKYVIRKGNELGIVYSDSKEEIIEIRKIMLRKEFAEIAEKYKGYLPETIYNRLLNDDFYEVNKNEI